jgi:hypothetical protein
LRRGSGHMAARDFRANDTACSAAQAKTFSAESCRYG